MDTNELWYERDGTRLFAVERGAGRPIILLHGGLADHHVCLRFGAPLAERFRIIAPDLRASGRSVYRGALTWDALADDIAALVRHLGLARAVIGGVSFGSACAVRVALRHPDFTEALLVLHPAFGGADLGLTPAQSAAMAAMDAAGRRALTDGMRAFHPLVDTLPAELRARARALFDAYDPASVAATTAFMASGAQPFATAADLAAITVPTLLVPGIDPQHPTSVADAHARHLPRCTVRSAPLDGLAPVIADFLDREVPRT